MKKIREQFADTVLDLGVIDPDLVVMVGDISHGILKPFAAACPGRYFNVGICEPTIVGMAAGLSHVGLTPVVHTIAPFLIERSYEQIKLDLGYQKLACNLVSVGGSFDYSQLGCSHHSYADVSLMAHLKRSQIFIPGSCVEFDKLFREVYADGSINYFRIPEHSHGVEFAPSDIRFGEAIKVRSGEDITIVTMGYHLATALSVSQSLSCDGISSEIIYYHTFKPFDSEVLLASGRKTKRVVVVEELSSHDGLYNQVMKSFYGTVSVSLKQLAVEDFIHGYGSFNDLLIAASLDHDSLYAACLSLVKEAA